MKKILFAIAIVMMFGFTSTAQSGGTDSFFGNYDNNMRIPGNEFNAMNNTMPGHGLTTDNVPLGSGLVILTALGAGYALARKRKEE